VRTNVSQEDGQGLVEFILLLPILLIVILGVIDLGRALGYKNDQTNLANQAARQAVVNQVPPGSGFSGANAITDYVTNIAPNELKNGTGSISQQPNGHGVTITYTFSDGSTRHCKGDPVKVTVTSHYNFLSFLIGNGSVPGAGLDMSSTATMRMESNYDTTSLTNTFTPTPPAQGSCP